VSSLRARALTRPTTVPTSSVSFSVHFPLFGSNLTEMTAIWVRALNELFRANNDQSPLAILVHSYIDVQVRTAGPLLVALELIRYAVQCRPRPCRQRYYVLLWMGRSAPGLHRVGSGRGTRRPRFCHHREHVRSSLLLDFRHLRDCKHCNHFIVPHGVYLFHIHNSTLRLLGRLRSQLMIVYSGSTIAVASPTSSLSSTLVTSTSNTEASIAPSNAARCNGQAILPMGIIGSFVAFLFI
jgi:hypothetical protein